MTSNKLHIVIVFQGSDINQIMKRYEHDAIGEDFFASELWGDRPNSTSRLNIVNYQALGRLCEKYNIDFVNVSHVTPCAEQLFRRADIIVINQVASPVSRRFLASFIEWRDSNPIAAKVVFGTEFTWFKELASGAISQRIIDAVYFENVLLRHTARTDVELYADERCHDAVIQEFELGIDADVVRSGLPASQRRVISFVRSPEGRITKNNDAIDRIVSLIKQSEALSRFDIKIIEPPYSSLDYWQLMRNSAFMVFTSLGETFSYCLNDAKAAGAISLFPAQMYFSCVGLRMAADSYPRAGIRFTSEEQLIRTLESLAASPESMDRAGAASREFVSDNFSIDAVARNWDKLFSGENSNTEHLYIYDPARHRSWDSVVAACRAIGARFAMPYLNVDIPEPVADMLTWHDDVNDIVVVRYYLTQGQDGKMRRLLMRDGSYISIGEAKLAAHTEDEAACFLQLACRTHKISVVTLDDSLHDSTAANAIKKVTCFAGLQRGLVKAVVRSHAGD